MPEGVVAVEVEVGSLALVFVVVEASPEVAVLALSADIGGLEGSVGIDEPQVSAGVGEPQVSADIGGLEGSVGIDEPQVSADIAELPVAVGIDEPQVSAGVGVPSLVLVPVSVVVFEVDSSGRPTFVPFPNIDHYASSASYLEVVGEESVHNPTGVRTNYGLCNILSNMGLHHNKNLEQSYNKPNPSHNIVSDTNDLPIDATTNHSRKTSLNLLHQEQRKHHPYPATLSHPEVRQMQWAEANQY
ncbi:MAG: hypothetical protein C0399_12970 [Syntrophus sp. (in: bacteria)]|nr:hypothetical protein [Syntrophus sp. (in: bacteria)]